MIQQFCQKLKFNFTGSPNDFDYFEFGIEENCPVLKRKKVDGILLKI